MLLAVRLQEVLLFGHVGTDVTVKYITPLNLQISHFRDQVKHRFLYRQVAACLIWELGVKLLFAGSVMSGQPRRSLGRK